MSRRTEKIIEVIVFAIGTSILTFSFVFTFFDKV